MGGNITPEGLRKDILWMKESGIGGFNIVEAGYRGIPQIVDKRPGKNNLKIRVTNLWVNRIIGDMQPDCTEKVSYTHQPFYKASDPILPSGLIGPLRIMVRDY